MSISSGQKTKSRLKEILLLIDTSPFFLSGWLGGPIPTVGQKDEVSNGWEEPSPESIRRRMEIDDGTAAWGDPGKSCCTLEGRKVKKKVVQKLTS